MQAARAHAYTPAAQLDASQRDNYRAIFAALRAPGLGGRRRPARRHARRAAARSRPGDALHHAGLAPRRAAAGHGAAAAQCRAAAGRGARPARPRARRREPCRACPSSSASSASAGSRAAPGRATSAAIAVADTLEPLLQPLIRDDKPVEAEALLATRAEELSPEALTAFRQRIAWVYYLNGFDADARRLGDLARTGPTEYAVHAEWVSGLAAWRMGDYDNAAAHFANVGARSSDIEFAAAGHYWAARADTAGGHPERVQPRLRAAARLGETFYGLLAQSALGIRQPPADMTGLTEADWRQLADSRNVRMAVALAEIGESDLAAELLRHQARIGRAGRAWRLDPPRRAAQPHRHPDVALAQRPARRPFRPARALSQSELAAGARLAGRPRPRPSPTRCRNRTSAPTR